VPRRDLRPVRAGAALLASLVISSGPARADESAPQLRALAEGLVGEIKTIAPRPSIAVTAGGVTDLEGGGMAGEVEVGVTWGRYSTGLFSPMHLSRIALAGRVSGLDLDTFVASALAGRTVDHLLGFTWEAGVAARLSDEQELGPVVRVIPRMGMVGLQVGVWWYATAPDEVGLSLGLTIDAVGMRREP
jgi:hypothetical protein